MTSLYMVRHGETSLSNENVYYGFTDLPLTEKGKEQCEAVKDKLKEVEFDVVISSSLERAINSAEIISSQNRENLLVCHELKEFNFGVWECKSYSDIQKEYEKESSLWMKDWINYTIPEGESFYAFYSRVKKSIEEIIKKYRNKKILIVSHDGTMKVISTVLLNMNIEDCWKFNFEFGTYSLFEVKNDSIIVKKINCI